MKKTLNLLILILLAVFITTFAAATIISENLRTTQLSQVKAYQDCTPVLYDEKQEIFGTCNRDVTETICNEDNSSCSDKTTSEKYDCILDTEIITKSKEVCAEPTSYVINDAVKLLTKDYVCDSFQEDKSIIIICDSIYDGNGNGECTSGESCMKFVVTGKEIKQYEKNSRNDFVTTDLSFFLDKASSEVLK
ncbi:MAG: hypothetical protein KKF44_06120 [Nanoarchaeota archaeon]|nr:hypothetical protein [Nanoarchaeota archaeon]